MRRVQPEMFRFTTVERSDLYGAVLDVFGTAGEHLETALGLDAVRERLRGIGWVAAVENEDLYEALRRLVQWELLDVVHNHAENYRTAEEYERRNLQYSLTRRGEAALAGLRHALPDPKLRADLLTKARSAQEYMLDHNWGNKKNRADEMKALIEKLEEWP